MVHLMDPIGGGRGQSVQERYSCSHVLAGMDKGWTRHPFVVDGGGDGLGPSLGLGEVDGGSSFCSQCSLALIRSAGHRWLLAHRQAGHHVEPLAALPSSLAIEWEEFHPWLRCHVPHHDCWNGLQCCGVLRC
jgi:hypothetical protein